jgi:hypothetical protein
MDIEHLNEPQKEAGTQVSPSAPPVAPPPQDGPSAGALTAIGIFAAGLITSTGGSFLGAFGLLVPTIVYAIISVIYLLAGDRGKSLRYAKAAAMVVVFPILFGFVVIFLFWAYCAFLGINGL